MTQSEHAFLATARHNQEPIFASMNALLADSFALYLRTKSYHWHMTGSHFRDHHLLLDEQASQILAMTDVIAERVRKRGGVTLRSLAEASRSQRLAEDDPLPTRPKEMFRQLLLDNGQLLSAMRDLHEACAGVGDVATTSVLEVFIDEAERRAWFLAETSGTAN